MHRVQLDDVLGVGAQHQHGDLVTDLAQCALGATPATQELGGELDAGLFVDGTANGGEFASVGWAEMGRETENGKVSVWCVYGVCFLLI